MLPRSCLRLADSKSNSSTRLPRRTTTRVSSGWVASISILLGIEQSLGRRSARGRQAAPYRRRDTARSGVGRMRERMGLTRDAGIAGEDVDPRRSLAETAMVVSL